MSDIVLLIDRLYCIDLFSCIAASLFTKLTLLYSTLLYYSVQAAVRASEFHHIAAIHKLPHRLAVNCNLLQGNYANLCFTVYKHAHSKICSLTVVLN